MLSTLCIETSSAHCTVALHKSDRLYHRTELLGRTHNEYLLTLLDEVFVEASTMPTEVDLVGFGQGPGSFTGVRMAASVTQAIALGAQAKVASLSSTQLLAASACRRYPEARQWIVSVKSRGQAFYLARYGFDEAGTLMEMDAPVLFDAFPNNLPGQLIEQWQSAAWVGPTPDWWSGARGILVDDLPINGQAMIDAALQASAAGALVEPDAALPLYLEGDSPWVKSAERG